MEGNQDRVKNLEREVELLREMLELKRKLREYEYPYYNYWKYSYTLPYYDYPVYSPSVYYPPCTQYTNTTGVCVS
jgi:hypothetical protein